jgi:hypothetical protein
MQVAEAEEVLPHTLLVTTRDWEVPVVEVTVELLMVLPEVLILVAVVAGQPERWARVVHQAQVEPVATE